MNYLSLDIGTTTVKGVLYDENGELVKESFRVSQTISPEVGFMEQNPDAVIELVYEIVHELVDYSKKHEKKIDFLALSSYMHSLMAVDKGFTPLTNIFLWSDNRSQKYAKIYKNNGLGLNCYKLTGTPIHPMSPLYKLMWLKNERLEIFNSAHKFISMKGYLVYKLTGECLIDYSVASATGLFNIQNFKWDNKILKLLKIDEERLEKAVKTTSVFNITDKDFLRKTGLAPNVQLVIGASDGCLANLGSHGLESKTGVITIGTSGAVRIVTNEPIIDPEARLFSYILDEGFYVSGGALNNGGIVFQRFNEVFGKKYNLDEVFKNYKNINNGLLFLPFLNGERAPYWNAKLKGAYLGINNTHDEKDFLYSTIQGINFAVKDVLSILKESVGALNNIYANGGFTNSKFWVERLSSILGKKIYVLNQGDAACFGAYLMGLKATKKINSWKDCSSYFNDSIVYDAPSLPADEFMFKFYKQSIKNNASILAELSDLQLKNF